MAIIVPGLPLYGVGPLVQGVRNGVVPPAWAFRQMAAMYNGMIAKRKKVAFCKWVNEADAYEAVASADTWRFRFHTGPDTTQVRCRMILAPVEDTEANAPSPRVYWTTVVEGGASTAQATVYHTDRKTPPYTVVPDDYRVVMQIWTVTPQTTYQVTLTQVDKLRVLGATVWEIPRTVLTTGTDTVIDPGPFSAGEPIHDNDIDGIWASMLTLWSRQRSHLFSWSRPSNTAATRTGATTYVNVLDATTTAWAAASEGFYTEPRVHGSHDTYIAASNLETVQVSFGAYISVTGGATVTAALIDQNAGTGAPIATVTSTSATAAWQTTTANWSAPSNAAMKLDVVFKVSDAAQTASIHAAGAFVYTA